MCDIREKERNQLFVEYEKLTRKHKPLAPYGRFVKRKYPQYAKEYKNLNSSEINKKIKDDWARLSLNEKQKIQDQYRKEVEDLSLNIDNSDQIDEYKRRL